MKASVHSFESFAALDGEGLRFAVFFSGCPLRCAFCHNPDTWERGEENFTPSELVRKISRYKPYFGLRGGATFSGGEPLCHAAFLKETVPLLEKEGIGFVVDTSGAVALTCEVAFVLKRAQSVLLDLKFTRDEDYRRFTGKGIGQTLEILAILEKIGKDTVLRTVIVPGINDSEDAIRDYGRLSRGFSCVRRHELLAFHTLGFFKYERLGIKNPLQDTPPLSRERLKDLQKILDQERKKNG